MKSLVSSKGFREVLVFAGLLGAGLLASSFLSDISFASVVSPDDSIDFVNQLTGGESDLRALINTILTYFLGFLAFICVIMIIYGGILYVTSAGSDDNVEKAKKILLYTAVGVVLIMVSYAIVNTLFGAAAGAPSVTSGTVN